MTHECHLELPNSPTMNGSFFPSIVRLRLLLLPRISCRHRHSSREYYHRRKPPPPPPPSPAILDRLISKLPPRYSSDDLIALLSSERNPTNCLNLFNHAIQKNPRFKPQTSVYLITLKKLGSAKHYLAMDGVAAQALANSAVLSPELLNTLIYYYSQARMLTKAVDVYKIMRDSDNPTIRPSLFTYNLLFAALLTREGNSFINHMYMENVRCLFRQMIDAEIEPDIVALNAVIKGYVLSLHVNDALRVFHQMNGLVYKCSPDDETYNWIIHGLCAQGRTRNAREMVEEMKTRGFVPGEKAYNSLASAYGLGGEADEAVAVVWEMTRAGRGVELVTFRTVLGEVARKGKGGMGDAVALLRELRRKKVLNELFWKELMVGLEEEFPQLRRAGGGAGPEECRIGFRRR